MTTSLLAVESVYRIAPDALCRQLDDEVAVYLTDRFETHLLDDKAWQVLQALQALEAAAISGSVPALVGHLLDERSPQDAPGFAPASQALAPVLAALVGIGVLTVSAC